MAKSVYTSCRSPKGLFSPASTSRFNISPCWRWNLVEASEPACGRLSRLFRNTNEKGTENSFLAGFVTDGPSVRPVTYKSTTVQCYPLSAILMTVYVEPLQFSSPRVPFAPRAGQRSSPGHAASLLKTGVPVGAELLAQIRPPTVGPSHNCTVIDDS